MSTRGSLALSMVIFLIHICAWAMPLSSTDPCERKKLDWLAAKARCAAAEASCNANPPRASECSEANTKCEKAKEARAEFLSCVEDNEK